MRTEKSPGRHGGRAILTYTALRAALLALCLVLFWFAGLGGVLLLVAALLVSGLLSWFMLQGPREAVGRAVERRVSDVQRRFDSRAAAEDAYVDALQGTSTRDLGP